jgi:hypothetical protein
MRRGILGLCDPSPCFSRPIGTPFQTLGANLIICKDEEEIFKILGVPCLPLEMRNH